MHYVYILQSQLDEKKFYIGITDDLKKRLQQHNAGESIHTNKFKPWKVKNYIAFSDKKQAEEFEIFLKTGNGRAFIKKRL